ncbi:ATP-binding protein [Chryseobacterium wangxinyae]|uniref:ATP-binding protein n=1 Tax=Chryseobacterium sp. CY353 TaxID=2997334 RepID=UPI0022719AD5|nr:tetratricopeptide repeat-containing sensor histidine kinase [Chryseobacterium sp. CY353]MCY0968920.1 hypothetical protein [Chryseobacterium sp. CY353]
MKFLFFLPFILFLNSCKKENITTDNLYYKKARVFRDNNSLERAFYSYNLAKNEYIKINDSLGVGNSLINMALIQNKKGDFFGSIESSAEANKFLKNENDNIFRERLATNYNNMGLSFHFLKNFEKSSFYYTRALLYIDKDESKFLCYNNIGDLLISQGKLDSALYYLNKASATIDSTTLSKTINNLAKAKYLRDKSYNPLPEFYQALRIREIQNDELGLNSSFETLSTYYLNNEPSLSLSFAKKMLNTAIKNESSDDEIIALQRIILLEPQTYLHNFEKFNLLNDRVQTERNQNRNQFAIIRYDVEQKNAQNQILKTENFKKNVGLVSLVLVLIAGVFYYKKRRKRLQQEKELEVKNTELKMSKKVHDKVANKVYHVMSEVENTVDMNKEVLLYKLDGIYQISRDISYEKSDAVLEHNFSQHLSQMLKSYSSEKIKVPIIGNEEQVWEGISDSSKVEIFYILQELMTNMKKHSNADKVLLDFERKNDEIQILYSDNGIGITTYSPKNGLRNTESRINSIGGTITFDTKTENGLKVTLSFPAKN